jgi:hypothetical protein
MRPLALFAVAMLVIVVGAGVLLEASKLSAIPAVAEPPARTISPEAMQLQIDSRMLPQTEVDSHI